MGSLYLGVSVPDSTQNEVHGFLLAVLTEYITPCPRGGFCPPGGRQAPFSIPVCSTNLQITGFNLKL